MVPQPVLAVLLLFPITKQTEALRREQQQQQQAAACGPQNVEANSVFYMKQTIGNACGTIGLLHSLCNAAAPAGGPLALRSGSFLERFLADTGRMAPEARGAYLEDPPEGAPNIEDIHEVCPHALACLLSADELEKIIH
jgi:ubiquitin carboxyl-terminal hydrolase L3